MAAEQILNENDFEDDFSDIDMEELDSYLTSPPVSCRKTTTLDDATPSSFIPAVLVSRVALPLIHPF